MSSRTMVARRLALGLALGLALVSPAGAQQAPLQGLDAYVERARQAWQVPGLAVAVVTGDSVVHIRGFGVLEEGRSEPVDEHTIFAIGSSSKAFTAAAAGLLVDDGVMAWDDPVIDHLPGFRLHDPYVTGMVTMRDLLAHRTGVAQAGLLWTGSGFSRAEILRRLRFQDGSNGFRTGWGYNNEMYLAAGEAVAAAAGSSWDAVMEERFFTPLGMSRSSTSVAALEGTSNVASPHILRDGAPVPIAYRNVDNIGPAGSINASVRDMAQWVRLHLGDGSHGGRRILAEGTVRMLQTPQSLLPPGVFAATTPEARLMTYGLGWFIHEYRGHQVVEHGGAIDGMHALVGMIPDADVGLVVLTNRYPQHLPYAVMYRVFDAYLGEPEHDWSGVMKAGVDAAAARAAERAAATGGATGAGVPPSAPALPLHVYAGPYDSPLYGGLDVTVDGDRLVLRRPDSVADLEHAGHHRFLAHWRSPGVASILGNTPILFTIGPDSEPTTVDIGGFAAFTRSPAGDDE